MTPGKKYLLLISLMIGFSLSIKAQIAPDFQLRLTNGKVLSSKQLAPGKPMIIVVFSPDCSHCKTLIEGIFKNISHFKNTHLILATFVQEKDIIAFEKKYETAKYPNVIVGADIPILFFQKFYRLTSTPFTVLYDKSGKMVVSYRNEHILNDLLKNLKTSS